MPTKLDFLTRLLAHIKRVEALIAEVGAWVGRAISKATRATSGR